MIVKTLAENYSSGKGITAQHGLSLFIETNSKRILFDMGQDGLFLKNACAMNVDITKVDAAVLSHGHYDHGGGASSFLDKNKTSKLYVNKNAFGDFFSKNGYIGIDKELWKNPRVILTEKTTEIFSNVTIHMGIAVSQKEKSFSNGLEKMENGMRETDDFIHEQYLLIEENQKRILFSGCSHRGILNIMEHFQPDIFIGGFHVNSLEFGSEDLKFVSEKLAHYNTEYYTCHCTGIEAYSYLKSKMGSRLNYLNCGKTIEI